MAEKKKLSNKGEKKATAKKAIDWNALPDKDITIILKGKETKAGKPTAKILVEKGLAELK